MKNQGLMSGMLENLRAEKPKKTVWGNYRIEGDKLVYRTKELVEKPMSKDEATLLLKAGALYYRGEKLSEFPKYMRFDNEYRKNQETFQMHQDFVEVIAQRVGTVIIGNSNQLALTAAKAWGNAKRQNRGTQPIQEYLQSNGAIMVPFTVFKEANLDLKTFKLIEKAKDEYVKVNQERFNLQKHKYENVKVKRHFTGAALFEVSGEQYLFDIDRREINHGIFNPFLVNLPCKVKSIKEAYSALIPKEVKDAIQRGLKVLRQGEWFFIPSKERPRALKEHDALIIAANTWGMEQMPEVKRIVTKLVKNRTKLLDGVQRPLQLKAGNNRPNNATGFTRKNVAYVTGKVKHTGREHVDLVLKGYYKAVPNTASKSFTITGDVD